MQHTTFSERHGFAETDAEVTVRHEAPADVRTFLIRFAYQVGLKPMGSYEAATQCLTECHAFDEPDEGRLRLPSASGRGPAPNVLPVKNPPLP